MNIVCSLEEEQDGQVSHIEQKEQYEWPHKWDKDVITYAIIVKSKDAGILSKQRRVIGFCLSTWALYIPIKFKRVKKTQNPDIVFYFVDNLNTHHIDGIPDDLLRFTQKKLKDKPTVLAFAGYPKTSMQGIIVVNDFGYNWDTKDHYKKGKKYHNLVNVLIHEPGHTLGLSHDTTNPGDDMMDPIYNNMTALSDHDIYRIRKRYGTRIFSSWQKFARLKDFMTYRKNNL